MTKVILVNGKPLMNKKNDGKIAYYITGPFTPPEQTGSKLICTQFARISKENNKLNLE